MSNAAEIMRLEEEFWQSMVDQEPEKAGRLLAEHAANVFALGIHHFSPAEYVKRAQEGPAKLTSFTFSNEKVFFPLPDVAVVTYEVVQAFEMNGQKQKMACFDTTTWVRSGGNWQAAVHTETPKQQEK